MERVKGIEPSSQAWEARILPLNHTRFRLRYCVADRAPVRKPSFGNRAGRRRGHALTPLPHFRGLLGLSFQSEWH